MNFSIAPYNSDSQAGSTAMPLWPALAEKAFCLKYGAGKKEILFYYDSAPSDAGLLDTMLSTAPVIVLIHGLGDEADSWRHIIPLLNSRGYRVLAVDLPGFGRSTAAGGADLKSHAAAIILLLEAVVHQHEADGRAIFLAGSSMGALVAETIALEKPDLAKSLMLIGGSIPGGPKNPGPLALAKLLFSRKWYGAYRENPEGAGESLRPYYADFDSLPGKDREFLRQRVVARVESRTQEKAFFQAQNSLVKTYATASARFARGIRNYKGKILLIWGESDRIMPLSSAETFKALRADIELSVIPGAGHLPQQEKPAETAQLMVDFMDKINAGSK